MIGRKRILISLIVFLIIFCSIFVVAVEYQFFSENKIEKKVVPFVRIFVDVKSGTVPFEVNFTSLVLYHAGDVDYMWDFGDNVTSSEVNPSHIYDQVGLYECTLTVIDDEGKISSDNVEIIVRDSEAPIVSITLSDLKPNRPFIPIFRHKFLSINYYGQNFRRIIDSRLFPKSFLNNEWL